MPRLQTGHIERLPSGFYHVQVYAGTDPLTSRATVPLNRLRQLSVNDSAACWSIRAAITPFAQQRVQMTRFCVADGWAGDGGCR